MDKKPISAAVLAAVLFLPHLASANWTFEQGTDALTDEPFAMATYLENSRIQPQSAVVRCSDAKIETFFDFVKFMNDGAVPVRYRFDKGEVASEEWLPSAGGTSVFAAEPTEIAREMIRGKQLNLEATDYRGQRFRMAVELVGAGEPVKKVLFACGKAPEGLAQTVPGLNRDLALEIERWGPKNTKLVKRVLSSKGLFDGPINDEKNAEMAFAVQKLKESYVSRCRAGTESGTPCRSMQMSWRGGDKSFTPPAITIVYDVAFATHQKEMGPLKIFE